MNGRQEDRCPITSEYYTYMTWDDEFFSYEHISGGFIFELPVKLRSGFLFLPTLRVIVSVQAHRPVNFDNRAILATTDLRMYIYTQTDNNYACS